MNSEFDDIQLMRRIANRDQSAFHGLYQAYGKAVYSLAYRILQNSALAEEVTQDTFLKIWQQRTKWDPEKGKLKSWLLTIAHYTAIDCFRRERRQPILHPDSIENMEEMISATQTDIPWQDGTVLKMLITQLSDEQSFLIELAFFRGMSHSQIADETQIPLGTVKTRLRTAIQRLRELWLESVNQTSGHI